MSNVGTSKRILKIAKFGLYVTIPIVLMYTFANNTKNIQKFKGNRSYMVHRPERPRPPSEEFRERAHALAHKKNKRSYMVYRPERPRPPSEGLREMARELARKNNTR